MISSFKRQYTDFFSSLALYSKSYGGFWQVFASPYFLLAAVFTGVSFNAWLNRADWETIIITTAPPLIAFSLGAIAIFNSIGDSKFRDALLTAEENEISPYVEINSMFVHFIFVQTVAFLLALISFSLPSAWGAFVSSEIKYGDKLIAGIKCFAFLIFSYGVMQIIATTFAILRISNSISYIHNMSTDEDSETDDRPTYITPTYVTINESIYVDKVITKNTYQYLEEE